MDNSEEEDGCYASRLRYLAVRVLGYTHTEAGECTVRRIVRELDLVAGEKRKQPSGDDGSWIDEVVS
jgi:hypothetical protein